MKCCGSQTTYTAPKPAAAPSRAREVAAQFDALLANAAFKPLATAMGFYGDLVVNAASQAMARGQRGGLTDSLQRAIEDTSRPAAGELR